MEKTRVSKNEELDEEHLGWAIDQRAAAQRTLLALHTFVKSNPAHVQDPKTLLLIDLLIGAAFSLWRAVFLADTFRDVVRVQQSQEAFLLKVLTNNAITFPDDRANRDWTVGYYLENAKLRLARAITILDGSPDSRELMRHLRLRGLGAELTRYEWESAHYALRALLKIIAPETQISADPPTAPEPKGLDKFL
jgi:hypothetical protein